MNAYRVLEMWICDIRGRISYPIHSREHVHTMANGKSLPADSILLVALKKTKHDKFEIPLQGIGSKNAVSTEVINDFHEMR